MSVEHPDSSNTSRVGVNELSRYDVLLIALPAAFMLAALTGLLSSVPMRTALVGASLFGGVVLTDALFINPPVER